MQNGKRIWVVNVLFVLLVSAANVGADRERDKEKTENVNDYTTLADDFDTWFSYLFPDPLIVIHYVYGVYSFCLFRPLCTW